MNTAARVETSSQRDKIHLSQETAELLIKAGKSKWVEPREDVVHAKGKGAMVTYWLVSASDLKPLSKAVPTVSTTSSETDGDKAAIIENTGDTAAKTAASQKVQRLVDWNCELLQQILKKIVARRKGKKRRSVMGTQSQDRVRKLEAEITNDRNLIEELVEIIPMPQFDAQEATDELEADKIDLGDNVVSELREFISLIASMYRDNPFHCWEHATHVTMSVTKLLARIVAPEAVHDKHYRSGRQADLAWMLHDHTYGITSDPLIQFAVVLSALIHDVDHRGKNVVPRSYTHSSE
jgi:hypothetical protein